jgi:hypothetical protein
VQAAKSRHSATNSNDVSGRYGIDRPRKLNKTPVRLFEFSINGRIGRYSSLCTCRSALVPTTSGLCRRHPFPPPVSRRGSARWSAQRVGHLPIRGMVGRMAGRSNQIARFNIVSILVVCVFGAGVYSCCKIAFGGGGVEKQKNFGDRMPTIIFQFVTILICTLAMCAQKTASGAFSRSDSANRHGPLWKCPALVCKNLMLGVWSVKSAHAPSRTLPNGGTSEGTERGFTNRYGIRGRTQCGY